MARHIAEGISAGSLIIDYIELIGSAMGNFPIGSVFPSNLIAIDSPLDGEVPTYNSSQNKFEWKAGGTSQPSDLNYRSSFEIHTDLAGDVNSPWRIATFNNGARIESNGEPNHPGVFQYRSSSTSVNGGVSIGTSFNCFQLSGDEETNIVFRISGLSQPGRFSRMGFMDSFSNASLIDGAYLYLENLNIKGHTKQNNNQSETSSNYNLSGNMWYRGKLLINSNATRVDFYIYDGSGNQLWTDYLTTNIPNTDFRDTGHGVSAWCSGLVQTIVLEVDFVNFAINKQLIR